VFKFHTLVLCGLAFLPVKRQTAPWKVHHLQRSAKWKPDPAHSWESKSKCCCCMGGHQTTRVSKMGSYSMFWLVSIITTTKLPIIIVGAGIVGLALAQSLKKEGIPFEIYERDPHLHARASGWGISIDWAHPTLQHSVATNLLRDWFLCRLIVARSLGVCVFSFLYLCSYLAYPTYLPTYLPPYTTLNYLSNLFFFLPYFAGTTWLT